MTHVILFSIFGLLGGGEPAPIKLSQLDAAMLDAEIAKVNQKQAELQAELLRLQTEVQKQINPFVQKIESICKRNKVNFKDLLDRKLKFDAETGLVTVVPPEKKPATNP